MTPDEMLCEASSTANLEEMRLAVQRGANPANAICGIHRTTPLHRVAQKPVYTDEQYRLYVTDARERAAYIKDNIECAKFLIRHHADVNARDHIDEVPLHRAAYNGAIEIMRLLLKHGANVDAVTRVGGRTGGTPLYNAIAGNQPEAVEVLLHYGAKLSTKLDYPTRGSTVINFLRDFAQVFDFQRGDPRDQKDRRDRIESILKRHVARKFILPELARRQLQRKKEMHAVLKTMPIPTDVSLQIARHIP